MRRPVRSTAGDLGLAIDNTVYALDSTTLDLSLTLFPWADFRRTKSATCPKKSQNRSAW